MFPVWGSLSFTAGEFMIPMTAALLSDPAADSQMPANTRGRAKSKHTQVVSIQSLSLRGDMAIGLCCSFAEQILACEL